MNSELKKNENEEETYPVLKIYKASPEDRDLSFIVMFTSYNRGPIVWTNDPLTHALGESWIWIPSEFEHFKGIVELSN